VPLAPRQPHAFSTSQTHTGCFHFGLRFCSELGSDANPLSLYEKVAAQFNGREGQRVCGAVLAAYGRTCHPDRPNADATNNNNRSLF
jgi:hypothetical protein